MSVETPRGTAERERYTAYADYPEGRGEGWMTFAGVMLMIIGVMNVIGGIAAVDKAHVYVGNAQYVFGDLKTWGWVLLLTGAVQVIAAFGIWARNQFARWLGVGFASVNALVQLLFLPAFPVWSIALFATDIFVLYALLVYGSKEETA